MQYNRVEICGVNTCLLYTSTVSPEEVELGETIVIKPGEKIPLDGEIIDGSTSVNTAALTGESLPEMCIRDSFYTSTEWSAAVRKAPYSESLAGMKIIRGWH